MGITKHDIKAMRNADSLVFFHNIEYAGQRGHFLKATQDGRNSSTGYDQQHWVQLTNSRLVNYEGGMGERNDNYPIKGLEPERIVASVVLLSVKVRMDVQTWLKLLREGDDLVPEFIAGNNNQNLRNAGLSRDTVSLWIYRINKTNGRNETVGQYHLDDQIGPVWSSVRMIRPAQPNEARV